MSGDRKERRARIDYVDRLRGLAVVGMFLVHTPAPWMRPEHVDGEYGWWISQISGMVAPVFLLLAGVSVAMIASRPSGLGPSFRRRIATRGLEILVVGYGLNLVFAALAGFHDFSRIFLKVDVLPCIGASLVLAALLAVPGRRWNWPALAAAVLFVVGAQITWRSPIAEILPAGISGYLAFIPGAARFPLFPYAGWVALGLFVGQAWWAAQAEPRAEKRFFVGLVAAGALLFAAGLAAKWAYYRYGFDRIVPGVAPPRTTIHHFLFKAGIVFGLFALARITARWLDRIPGQGLVLFGRASLFGYCAHLLLVYHLAVPFARKSLGPLGHLVGVALLTAAMLALTHGWVMVKKRLFR